MLAHGYDQMVRENRIWINKDMILLTLASLELNECLDIRTVLATQETFSVGNFLFCQFRRRRNHPGRVELELYGKTSDLNLSYTDILQSPEVITRKRPA